MKKNIFNVIIIQNEGNGGDFIMTIGDRIRTRREELGMSQEELSQKLGYKSRSSVNKIENDGRNLPQKKIAAIAKVLETTPSYIIGWREDTDEIIKKYKTLDDSDKEIIDDLIEKFHKKKKRG